MDDIAIRAEHLRGDMLYGNDLTGDALARWYADEEHGFADLTVSDYAGPSGQYELTTRAWNQAHAALLPQRRWDTVLVLGCADGEDVLSLGLDMGRIVAIEPARHWWTDSLGGIPAEFRAPTLDGTIDLPTASVDLVIALGVLHHIATVEHVVAELGRVLRPGGWALIREPMTSMGDFRVARPGMTRHERGIAPQLMKRFIAGAGLQLEKAVPCYFGVLIRAAMFGGIRAPLNSRTIVRLDAVLSRLLAFRSRYWRPRRIDKLAPNTMAYIASKPGS